MVKPRKILVTGGLGLIGHNVVQKLCTLGHDVVVTDTRTGYGIIPHNELACIMRERIKLFPAAVKIYQEDIADEVGITSIMRSHTIDAVVHLASFPRQKVVNSNPQRGSRTMIEGLLNLLECATRHAVQKFVYISSSMVYGNFADNVREDAVCQPQGQYGIMKLAGEWLVRDYTRRTSITHVIMRPSAVYGPLDVENRVVSKLLLAALRGEVLKVRGAGEKLDFTFVDDAADGIVAAVLRDQANNNTYNITKSHSHTLLQAAELAVRIVGCGSIEVQDRDLDFPSRGALNIDAARQDLAFDPKIDIQQGFEIYHAWLKDSLYRAAKTVSQSPI